MKKNAAPVRGTSGEGFNFEDKVAAFFLTSMLARSHPCGPEAGIPSQLEWQVPGAEQGLDDLLVTLSAKTLNRLAISIKINNQVTQSGFPRSFVESARKCCEDSLSDLPCLAVGGLAGGVRVAWHTLLNQARLGNPKSVATRYTSEKNSSAIGRALFSSFTAEQKEPDAGTVSLVKRVRLFYFDFMDNESRDESRAIEMCQGVLVSGQGDEAIRLWNQLIGIAAARRAAGGTLDYPGLIEALDSGYALKDRVDHSRDWATLDRRSVDVMKSVRDTVGDRVCLVRGELMNKLRSYALEGGPVLIAGDGGGGKSSIAKRLAQSADSYDRCLWLSAVALDFDSIAEVERFLGIANPLEALLTAGSGLRACLVLDGLEVFTQRARSHASSLLELLGPDPSLRGWTILATTRPQAVVGAHQIIARAGIESVQTRTIYIKPPSDGECSRVLQTCRGFNGLLIRRELRSALSNLKLLDWLASDNNGFPEIEVQSWAGTTGIINTLWGRWIGNDGASAVRSGVMKSLGRLEGEGLIQGVGLSELDAAELGALKELESLDLLNVSNERVLFRHDTLGDWARLRILIEKSPRGKAISEYARFPRWHDAIRLYSQRLLEMDGDAPSRWMDVLSSLDGDTPNVVVTRDMFVEGLFCTPNASALLEHAWPALVADHGLLLRRMLNRFQYVATIPDPRQTSKFSTETENVEFAALMRIPWWPLWPSILTCLSEHSGEVARLCPIEAAQVCALWLRCVPIGAIGRIEASSMALSIGREIQASSGEGLRHIRDQTDTAVFEAVLHAAPEHPDEVSDLCLELARRKPDPPEIVARAKAHEERIAKETAEWLTKKPPSKDMGRGAPLMFDRGVLRPQFPEGPSASVNEALQRAVFETQGINTLASVRPDQAGELLLACSLEPPRYVRRDDMMMGVFDSFGIEDVQSMGPSMFFRGPWLTLLRQKPELGIDCIMCLVNQATEQWKQHWLPPDATEEQRSLVRMSLTTDEGQSAWNGNMRIYGWHRERFCSSHLLASALMALERYLYECLDQDEPIDHIVTQILSSGRSVATLAVLVSVAKYKPVLLTGCLKPLLGAWPIYGWDLQLVHDDESWSIGFFQWTRSGEQIFNIVRDWHTMSHRKQTFREHAITVMLTNQDVRDMYTSVRDAWKIEVESGTCVDPESLELLIARFDPDNYQLVPRDDDAVEVVFEWPESLKARAEVNAKTAQDIARFMTFPFECRELLDKDEPLSDGIAQKIWDQTNEFSAFPDENRDDDLHIDRRPDAVIGGIAVLFTLAPDWVAAHENIAKWCWDQIEVILDNPPTRSVIDTEHSISTDRWHSFMAQIAVTLLVDDSSDLETRSLVSDMVMSYWYATTGVALAAAFRRREKLSDEFNCIVNLAVLWAALRTTLPHYQPSDGELERFNGRITRLRSAFVAGRIPSRMLNWQGIAGISNRARVRSHRLRFPDSEGPITLRRRAGDDTIVRHSRRNRLVRHHPGFDIEALRHGFVWLSDPIVSSAVEVVRNTAWLEQLLGVTLSTIPNGAEDGHEVDGTPYQYDYWVFGRVATFVAQLDSAEAARRLWQPIMDLGTTAHYWVNTFLRDWTVSAFTQAASKSLYFDRWCELIQYANDSPVWIPLKPSTFRLGGLWEHLLGMHLGASVVAADGNQAEFAKMKDFYGDWAEVYLHNAHTLRPFLNLLQQPGARPLLYPAVPWLLRVAEVLHPNDWTRDPIADDLATVMNLAWTWHAESIAANNDRLTEYMELLNILVKQQSRIAMALRDSVARTAVTPEE